MAYDNYRIIFERNEFPLVTGPVDIALLTTALAALPLESPILEVRALPAGGVAIEWASLIGSNDRERVARAIDQHTQGPTTSESFVRIAQGPVVAPSAELVTVLDFTSPKLDAGRYRVLWLSQLRLTNVASGTFALALATFGGLTQRHHSPLVLPVAFNGGFTFERRAGESLRVALQLSKVGIGAVSAEMTDACFCIDKIG